PSAASRSQTWRTCSVRPHHAWSTRIPGPAPPAGRARYPVPAYFESIGIDGRRDDAPMPRGEKSDACDLCEAARITHWFHEDEVCWIAECEICDTPMVVWRWHGIDPSAEDLAHMHGELARVTSAVFDAHYV